MPLDVWKTCQYANWYPQYRKHAFKSQILPCPTQFLTFLEEDGLSLPESSRALPKCSPAAHIDEDDHQDWSESSSDAEASSMDWSEIFKDYIADLDAAIESLGGAVAPKLNWSSPTDATWVSTLNSLCCNNADQVILLLKSSDRITFDLTTARSLDRSTTTETPGQQPATAATETQPCAEPNTQTQLHQQQPLTTPEQSSGGTQPSITSETAPPALSSSSPSAASVASPIHLVLRKWYDLRPEREFRCFVHQHRPCGISQRDVSQAFPQLASEVDSLKAQLLAFYQQHVASSFGLPDYAIDLYIATNGTIRIMDFNPITDTTSPLLFTWDELPYSYMHTTHTDGSSGGHAPEAAAAAEAGNESAVELRVLTDAAGIQMGQKMATGMPFDMLQLQDSLEDIIGMMQQQTGSG